MSHLSMSHEMCDYDEDDVDSIDLIPLCTQPKRLKMQFTADSTKVTDQPTSTKPVLSSTVLTSAAAADNDNDDCSVDSNNEQDSSSILSASFCESQTDSSTNGAPDELLSSANSIDEDSTTTTITSPTVFATTSSVLSQQSVDTTSLGNLYPRKQLSFDSVEIFYFHRQQSYCAVPSIGASALGMDMRHFLRQHLSLDQYEHFSTLTPTSDGDPDNNGSSIDSLQMTPRPILLATAAHPSTSSVVAASSSCGDGSHDNQLKRRKPSSHSCAILQPIVAKQRRTILKNSGLNRSELNDTRDIYDMIRSSRDNCGCQCRDGICDMTSCVCVRNQIRCQVDRGGFPCSCSLQSSGNQSLIAVGPLGGGGSGTSQTCTNPLGRLEFNPVRVRTHFIHTMMRLQMQDQYHHNSNQRPRLDTHQIQCDKPDKIDISQCNSTIQGSCRDCQNDKYLQVLMNEWSRQIDEKLRQAATLQYSSNLHLHYQQQQQQQHHQQQQQIQNLHSHLVTANSHYLTFNASQVSYIPHNQQHSNSSQMCLYNSQMYNSHLQPQQLHHTHNIDHSYYWPLADTTSALLHTGCLNTQPVYSSMIYHQQQPQPQHHYTTTTTNSSYYQQYQRQNPLSLSSIEHVIQNPILHYRRDDSDQEEDEEEEVEELFDHIPVKYCKEDDDEAVISPQTSTVDVDLNNIDDSRTRSYANINVIQHCHNHSPTIINNRIQHNNASDECHHDLQALDDSPDSIDLLLCDSVSGPYLPQSSGSNINTTSTNSSSNSSIALSSPSITQAASQATTSSPPTASFTLHNEEVHSPLITHESNGQLFTVLQPASPSCLVRCLYNQHTTQSQTTHDSSHESLS